MTRTRPRLFHGSMMTCPRCKRDHDVLAYARLQQIDEFADETVPIYKCPSCKWIFALSRDIVVEVLTGAREEVETLVGS